MLKKSGVAGVVAGLVVVAAWGAEMREWSSVNGSSTFKGSVVKVLAGKVVLTNEEGRQITVPIAKLCAADRAYLKTFAAKSMSKRVDVGPPTDLPYATGAVVGPIEAGSQSHYFLYLPTTLKRGRKAPLLFHTHFGGGNKKLLKMVIKGAELNGWVMAVSVESRNNNDLEANVRSCKDAVRHILKTLPVDDDRLYFTGSSGGGAMAFRNAYDFGACGAMPNVGYIPSEAGVPSGDFFIINGGSDYNRYTSAHARKEIGRRAVHRLHPGGHGVAPAWLMVDGMVWLEGRYLEKKGRKNKDEQADYETSILQWIGELKETQPYRAYYWAWFLNENLELSSRSQAAVKAVLDELGQDQINRLYVEGLDDIDKLSLKKLSVFGSGSLHKHADSGVVSACRTLLRTYRRVPIIEETLEAISKSTK